MTDPFDATEVDISDTTKLYEILKNCAQLQSYESLTQADAFGYNDVYTGAEYHNIYYNNNNNNNMISMRNPSFTSSAVSGNISCSSFASDESCGDNILEENGRISLAYENLRTIPRRIAEKFAAHTKCLDLSYNNFQNLSFLTFFEELHTLVLDHNNRLDVNSLPHLSNLKILWINNCDISNISDWVHRIKTQCPALQQLSVMGNPGVRHHFNYNNSFSTIPTTMHPHKATLMPVTNTTIDYREYILHVLPNLAYLDGVARSAMDAQIEPQTTKPKNSLTRPTLANGSGKVSNGMPIERKLQHNNNNCKNNRNNDKTSPRFSFKDFFRLNHRKKTATTQTTRTPTQSMSTN